MKAVVFIEARQCRGNFVNAILWYLFIACHSSRVHTYIYLIHVDPQEFLISENYEFLEKSEK